MMRRLPMIAVLQAFLALQGCALFSQHTAGHLESRIDRLEAECCDTAALNSKKLERLLRDNETLSERISHLIEQNQRLSLKNQALEQRLDHLEGATGSKRHDSALPAPKAGTLKMKVLSGDGDLDSARAVARALKNKGYRIPAVDYATRSDFAHDTVFFSEGNRETAEKIAFNIGPHTVVKPLTWSSAYDIIVVTGLSR